MPNGIQWRVVKIRANDFAGIKAMADGWHFLQSNGSSMALDYIRSRPMTWDIRHNPASYADVARFSLA
jgi:hypothetical protein